MPEPERHQVERCESDAALREQECLNEMTKNAQPISRDTRIDHYFRDVIGADSLEYVELSFKIERRLGVCLTNEDWSFLSGGQLCNSTDEWEAKYAPLFTFGRLADLVAHRAELEAVKPVTILGARSLSAGAFRRIEELAHEIHPRAKPFAPSTLIQERFHGQKLAQFWARLHVMSRHRIPPLPRSWLRKVVDSFSQGLLGAFLSLGSYGLLVWGVAVVLNKISPGDWLIWLGAGILPVVILFSVNRLLYCIAARLGLPEFEIPKGITTFRDLAELIAGERGGWCEKCGYDLTGLTGNRCPECGSILRSPILPDTSSGAESPKQT